MYSGRTQVALSPSGPLLRPAARGRNAARGRSQRSLSRPAGEDGEFRRFSIHSDMPALALDHASPAWGLSEVDDLPPEIDLVEPMGEPAHYRYRLAHDVARGAVELCGLADGFLVHCGDIRLEQPQPMWVSAPDILRVRIASDSDGEYVTGHGDRIDLRGPGSVIIIEPSGVPPAKAVFFGHNRTVAVYVHRSTIQRLYAGRVEELPAVLQAFVAGELSETIAQCLPLNATLLRCLEDLHDCDLDGHSRRLFVRSKAIEILCHAFKALGQDDEGGASDTSAQIRRGVIKAQQRLTRTYASPPSLDDLARDVGLSRSSLCAGFRQIVGQTVFDYILDLRMREALSLLNERTASITQIAYAVGYSHPSSFSLAVQKRFGATPSELRRRGSLGL